MIKSVIYIFLVSLLFSCTTTQIANKEVISDNDLELNFLKSICFPLSYLVLNVSNDEDIKLLVKEHPDFLKDYFDNDMEALFQDEGFTIVEEHCNYQLIVKELTFKEFKIEVDGPTVNVASVRIDYNLITQKLDTVLSETIDKESIPAFEETVFQQMCKQLSNKVITRIKTFVKE